MNAAYMLEAGSISRCLGETVVSVKKIGVSGAPECLQSPRGREMREEFSCPPGAANLAWPNRGAVASGIVIWSSDWDRFLNEKQ